MAYTGTKTPDVEFNVGGHALRLYKHDNRNWFVAHDIRSLIQTGYNATQLCRTLPAHFTMRMKVNARPEINLLNEEGVRALLDKHSDSRRPSTKAGAFKKWFDTTFPPGQDNHSGVPTSLDAQIVQPGFETATSPTISRKRFVAMEGELKSVVRKLETLEALIRTQTLSAAQ
jgi:hypothetical protein